MTKRNIIVYIEDLDISDKAKHILRRKGISTLNGFEKTNRDKIAVITASAPELKTLLEHADEVFDKFETREKRIAEIYDEVKDYHVAEVPHLGSRACNALERAGILKVGDLLQMSQGDITRLPRVGVQTRIYISAVIDAIITEGKAYFLPSDRAETELCDPSPTTEITTKQIRKGFDFSIIDTLIGEFYFKPGRLAKWFGVSGQRIYSILKVRPPQRADIWTEKLLTEHEKSVLSSLIYQKTFDYSDNHVTCCVCNNRKDNLACLFVYEDDIKCFFLQNLPVELQQMIIAANYHRYTEKELAGEADGKIIHVIKKPFFSPTYPQKFKANAQLRGMTKKEYSIFLSGYPLGNPKNVTDEQIIAFFEKNLVNGKVCLSSAPPNQWIRSLASRNGYAIKEFIELYGYESTPSRTKLITDKTRQRHIEELEPYVVEDKVVYMPADSAIYRQIQSYANRKGISVSEYLKDLGYERTSKKPGTTSDIQENDIQK